MFDVLFIVFFIFPEIVCSLYISLAAALWQIKILYNLHQSAAITKQANAHLLRHYFLSVCIHKQAVWLQGSADMVCPCPPLTLLFDRLTLKLVCDSHLKWGTFLPNLGTLGLWVLELSAMYAKATLIAPFPTAEVIISAMVVIMTAHYKRLLLCVCVV